MTDPATFPSRELAGWGRTPAYATRVARPEQLERLAALVGGDAPVIGRGLGRSYGDAAVNPAGVTVLIERLNRMLDFDPRTGVLRCEAGVSIQDLIEVFLPRGYLPPVTPGTKHVTMAGAIACDIHGKSHHKDGAFSRHVREFTLLTPDGALRCCSRTEHPELFWATVGGMGLTGFIVDVTLELRPVETSWISVDYERAPDLDAALARFEESDEKYQYSVAWIDCLSRGRRLGRSVLMRGNGARAADLPARLAGRPLEVHRPSRMRVPVDAPAFLLNPLSVATFNAFYYRRYPRNARARLTSYEPFFYPLDSIEHWNRLYGRRGFLQYQCVLPYAGGREGLIRILELIANERHASFLAVLKRFGTTPPEQMLSFLQPGYTLAVDFPRGGESQDRLLARLDDIVIRSGGRVYLAKDARLSPEAFRAMYPRWKDWMDIRRRIDPERRFRSALSARLELDA